MNQNLLGAIRNFDETYEFGGNHMQLLIFVGNNSKMSGNRQSVYASIFLIKDFEECCNALRANQN